MKHLKNNFQYPRIAKEMGVGERIFVEFIINSKGAVRSAKIVRGENKHLKEEALRLINTLPDMIPAKQDGKAVAVAFTIPINFTLD